MARLILGISAFYHDSAAALLCDGDIVAAAQEERFTRRKHDPSFPANAVRHVLREAGVTTMDQLEAVAFYDKPFLKFERLLETYHAFAPRGLKSFLKAIPIWIKEKLFIRKLIQDELAPLCPGHVPLLFPEHHLSHAASAFFPSPFESAAILTIDGVGEWATTTIGVGSGNSIRILRQLDFPHSLGLFYSACTHYCGFKVNSGEYKLMGLAPYGDPDSPQTREWRHLILDEILDLREDGSLLLNMDYFAYATGLTMCHNARWERLFGIRRREKETELTQPYMNLALAVQQVTEEVVLRMARTAKELTGESRLVMAGGVALNCVANGRILRSGLFEDLWIQPAAGDAGGALGAAYAAHHVWQGEERRVNRCRDQMKGAYLGPGYASGEILMAARRWGAPCVAYDDFDRLCADVAESLAAGQAVGWFQGRMEYGPRALGHRSILADPRNEEMQRRLNLKIKYREGFRPFAPAVLEEDIGEYFDLDRPSPYMLLVAPVKEERRKPLPDGFPQRSLWERLYHIRSDIPAVTHVDFSARIQSVNRDVSERFWKLIRAFKDRTGFGLLVNTSFNVRGEPIVCSPEDAYRCFMRTDMDLLVMENCVFRKEDQPPPQDLANWQATYELD
ncbi:MAG: carbamoyltransferase [Deltaproteobacteria bacterium]|nr:carbamoyltransferase [Deltaproteobacteria bacterium]